MIAPEPVAEPTAPRPLAEIPGVRAVHDPRPPLTRALGAASSALRIDTVPPVDGVFVSTDADGMTAAAAVTVSVTARTPDVARAVADTLRVQHPGADRITVQVRRIA
ncbi:hypothetical protein [Microbacterium thalli]|uniref:hypothetical protein n=1 Tax=Microbacterium thalli TaxID=3027921 RepID=UPI0023669EFC|nr:hypothetical protein [Microbacterium thalli]MDD7928735.1 hypothetical protein [Microbacterium thalli]